MARVALILPDLRGGGAERVALTIARDFIDHGDEVDFVLLSGGGELMPLVPPEACIFELQCGRFRTALPSLVRYFRQRKPNAAQAFMWPVTVAAILARRISGNKGRLIVSDHTTVSKHYAHAGGKLLKSTVRLCYPAADARVVVSQEAASDLARLSGLPKASFKVIYNPLPPANDEALRMEPDWGGSGVRLLTVGSLKSEKNHSLLLDAVALLSPRLDSRIAIVGDGPLRRNIVEHAERLGLAERLVMPGFVLDPSPYYASANLFVLTSDFEGYPLVLPEALRVGLNVVSTDCTSGPREILDGGLYGRLAPVGDAKALAHAITDALNNPIPPARLKARATSLSAGSLECYRLLMLG